jgi:PST family polysaccharide transporter
VGVYYFAFNLSLQTAMLLALNLDAVLMPVLSKLKDDVPRQRDAFLSAARAVALVGVPVCFLQAAVAGPAIRLVFDPKWYGAVHVLQVLSVGMALRVVTHPAQTLMRAQGRFATLTWLNAIGAIAFVAVTAVAAAGASDATAAAWVALAVAGFFAVEGPGYALAAIRPAGGTWRDVTGIYAVPLGLAAAAAAAGWLVGRLLPAAGGRGVAAVQMAVVGGTFAAVYVAGVWLIAPPALHDLLGRLGRPRKPAETPETAV